VKEEVPSVRHGVVMSTTLFDVISLIQVTFLTGHVTSQNPHEPSRVNMDTCVCKKETMVDRSRGFSNATPYIYSWVTSIGVEIMDIIEFRNCRVRGR